MPCSGNSRSAAAAMTYARTLTMEALVVGLVLALAVHLVGPVRALGQAFALGAGIHLFFEATGMNGRYCRTGAACMR